MASVFREILLEWKVLFVPIEYNFACLERDKTLTLGNDFLLCSLSDAGATLSRLRGLASTV